MIMNPSWQDISKHYYAARSMFKHSGSHSTISEEVSLQSFNRKVHVEFHRRLREAGIYVEGA